MSMISLLSLYKAFEDQFLIFEKSATRALDELQTTIKTIKNRNVPTAEDTNKLYNLLKSLQDSYDDTYKTACTILGNDLKSKYGSQLDAINKIISDKMLKAEDLFHNSKFILMEFLTVKADYKPHMEALIPFYNKAEEIIKEIQENRIAIEQLELDIIPYSLFLEALNLNTSDTEKRELLYAEIDRFFPACVSRALYSGKYFCVASKNCSSEGSDSNNTSRDTPHMQEISEPISNTTEKNKERQHTRIDNTITSSNSQYLTQASSHISVATHNTIGSDVDPAPVTN